MRFFYILFGEHVRRPLVVRSFHADLMEAYAWLKPQVGGLDAVFVTTQGMTAPHMLMLVALSYDPHQWFRDERDVTTSDTWDLYHRVGKFYFMYPDYPATTEVPRTLQKDGRPEHVAFIVRPGEVNLSGPAHTIAGPDGRVSLLVYVRDM